MLTPKEKRDIELNHPVDFMRLTLTYEGALHAASSGNTQMPEKHRIRRAFHRQLMDIWNDPPLSDSLNRWKILSRQQQLDPGPNLSTYGVDVGAYRCVPLVTKRLWAVCELDILFLRRESAGGIVNQAGDIDNRLKVLFDALRMPLDANELPASAEPDSTEMPFFCLLENDSLITAFRIESERLLGPFEPERESNVKLVIRATVKLQRLTYGNIGLGDVV